jgi:cystine transport system substrate-binding protein
MKKVLAGLMALCTVALTACGAANNTAAPQNNTNTTTTGAAATTNLYQKIVKDGKIVIGTEGTYAPFDYHDASGKLTGFDVEIAQEVAKRLGVKAEFVESKWDGLLEGMNAGRYEMVADEVTIKPDRLPIYDFSNPYIVSRAVLIVRSDNKTIHGFQDLKGKNAGQSLTSNLADIARQYGAKIVPTTGFNEAMGLLESGRIDATINDGLSFLDFKKHNPNAPVKVVANYNNASKQAFAFPKGNADLVKAVNKALDSMMKDGTYLKISQKYFGTDVSK